VVPSGALTIKEGYIPCNFLCVSYSNPRMIAVIKAREKAPIKMLAKQTPTIVLTVDEERPVT